MTNKAMMQRLAKMNAGFNQALGLLSAVQQDLVALFNEIRDDGAMAASWRCSCHGSGPEAFAACTSGAKSQDAEERGESFLDRLKLLATTREVEAP